jgi:hypothetical protein
VPILWKNPKKDLVNRTLCRTTVPILWKNSKKDAKDLSIISDVILSYFSEESRNTLRNQGIDLFKSAAYQQPLFDYISFWRYLDLNHLDDILKFIVNNKSIDISLLRDIVSKIFSRNAKFTHLITKHQCYYILGAEHCFSKLRSLQCSAYYPDSQKNLLEELTRTCKSIQQLELVVVVVEDDSEVRQVAKLIKAQESLHDVNIAFGRNEIESHLKIIEESLIKHVHTIQHLKINWLPITKILSYDCKNLLSLDIQAEVYDNKFNINWSHLENLSLPVIKSLRVRNIPPKISISLIENTKGHLTELNIYIVEDKIPIQVIYKNCPNLKYLQLDVNESNLLEFKKLLIECQYLEGLMISLKSYGDNLFEILANFSPTNLVKFAFFLNSGFYYLELKSLKSSLDNWENRHPMLLQFTDPPEYRSTLDELLEKYKKKGIIKKYFCGKYLGDFCWDLGLY